MRWMYDGPGVTVVASVPTDGPVPPPTRVVVPLLSASDLLRADEWMWVSMAPGVRILPSPAITSVAGPMTISTCGWMSGLPARPMAVLPFLIPISALMIPGDPARPRW